MRICIDVRPALSHPTGVGSYVENLVIALGKLDTTSEFHLFSSSWKERYPQKNYGPNFRIHDRRIPVSVLNFCWNRLATPTVEKLIRTPVDVVHSATPLIIPTRSARKITTVHDLYFFYHPEEVTAEIHRDYKALLKNHCLQSDAIITVSQFTRQRLLEVVPVAPSRVFVVHHGTDPFFQEPSDERSNQAMLRQLGIHKPYFLFVGTLQPRKNIHVLLKAFERWKDDTQLVLAGLQGWGRIFPDVPCRILYCGYVSKEELRALYQQALAFVFPSLEEGFGLPLLEAMASGCPVLASDIPVFREIAGDACLFFDPQQPDDLLVKMESLLASETRRILMEKGKTRAGQFKWEETAGKTLEIYRSLT